MTDSNAEISQDRAAYEGYVIAGGGKSLVHGTPLPPWDELAPEIREAWRAAADGAVMFASLQAGRLTGDGVDALADNRELRHLNSGQASFISDLRAALSSLADRAEAGKAITGDEAEEYRKLAATNVLDMVATAADGGRATGYHETVTDFRRTLVKAAAAWERASREHDSDRPATLMAYVYSYTLAAILGLAEREFGPGVAKRLAFEADEILNNGDFDALNADVTPKPEADAGNAEVTP